MLTPELKSQFESQGHQVIYARVFVHDDGKEINGLDESGVPIVSPIFDCNGKQVTPTVILPAKAVGKFYIGDDAQTVKSKILANTPDLERVEEYETKPYIIGPVDVVIGVRTVVDRLR